MSHSEAQVRTKLGLKIEYLFSVFINYHIATAKTMKSPYIKLSYMHLSGFLTKLQLLMTNKIVQPTKSNLHGDLQL